MLNFTMRQQFIDKRTVGKGRCVGIGAALEVGADRARVAKG